MTVAKCHPDMVSYARNFTCPTCERRRPPRRTPKATMPYRPTQFNHTVGIDLKWIKDVANQIYYPFNMIDLATGFNNGLCLESTSSKVFVDTFEQFGISWAGAPVKIVADQCREVVAEFSECVRHLSTAFKMMSPEAPWQNRMVERHS